MKKKFSKKMVDSIVKIANLVSKDTIAGKLLIPLDKSKTSYDEIILVQEYANDIEYAAEPFLCYRSYLAVSFEEYEEIDDNIILLMDYIDKHYSAEQIEEIEYSIFEVERGNLL